MVIPEVSIRFRNYGVAPRCSSSREGDVLTTRFVLAHTHARVHFVYCNAKYKRRGSNASTAAKSERGRNKTAAEDRERKREREGRTRERISIAALSFSL